MNRNASAEAKQFVTAGLTACLPPGVPLMGNVDRAAFTGKERVVAHLTMFDGMLGVVEVSKWTTRHSDAWEIGWKETGGHPCYWNGTAWVRDKPRQATLFDLMPGGAA